MNVIDLMATNDPRNHANFAFKQINVRGNGRVATRDGRVTSAKEAKLMAKWDMNVDRERRIGRQPCQPAFIQLRINGRAEFHGSRITGVTGDVPVHVFRPIQRYGLAHILLRLCRDRCKRIKLQNRRRQVDPNQPDSGQTDQSQTDPGQTKSD